MNTLSRTEYINSNMDSLFRVSFRSACLVGAAIVMLTAFMDYFAAPEHFYTTLLYRFVTGTVLVGIYFLTARVKSISSLRVLAYIGIALAAVGAESLILTLGDHQPQYFVGMILLAIGAVTIIAARPLFHVGSLSVIYFIYVIPSVVVFPSIDRGLFIVANTLVIACFSVAFVAGCARFKQLVRNYGLQFDLEAEKRRRERQLSANLPGIVFRLNFVGEKGMKFFNEMLEPITGYSEEELSEGEDYRIDPLIVPEDHAAKVSKVNEAIEERNPFEVEYRIRHKSGAIRYLSERGRPVIGDGGKVLHIDGIILDVTERKRAEIELRESEERYRRLVESAPDVVLLFDVETLRIEDVNQAATKVFGYTRDEFLSMTTVELSGEKESTMESMAKLRNSDVTKLEVKQRKHIRKDGTSFYGDISVVTFYSMGRKKVIGSMRDVTERMKAEEEKRELEQMYHQAQKLEALGELSGGISHDFNNILAIIRNNIELARMQGFESVSGHLDKAIDAVQRGKGLVGNLLNFSRGMVVEPEVVNIGEIAEGTVKFMKKNSDRSVKVDVNIAPGIWNIYGNPSQLQQVVMNLYQNARDAVAELAEDAEPSITFRADNVVRPRGGAYTEEEEFVRLKVTDNGCGMDNNTQSRIFEPFFSTKGGASKGIGLSAVYGIIKRSGGWIDVESEPGTGTALSVYLPRYSGEGDSSRPVAAGHITGGTETVLIVDDERHLADSTGEMLDALGYKVMVAYSGDEALEVLREGSDAINLVLLDMLMPGISGPELIESIRQIAPDIRVILTSGNMDERVKNSMDAVAFLPKPFSIEALSSTLREALGGESDTKGLRRHLQRVKLYSVKEESLPHSENITSADSIYKLFKHIAYESREKFIAVFLDTQKRIIAYDELTQGTFNEVVVHAQEVLRSALLTNAAGIILVHNHPSGDVEPSVHDIELTSRMVDSCKMFNIEFLDHIVIGRDGYFSFSKEETTRLQ